ncbi:hypothetical protein KO02_08075 [Sphingobacterium sp. ML3W]|uniref:hypothetical protein n=1 Tax=Sphingobacterium sp. ML3W TaxID=1538644 RepID=UPI0004F7F07B|nr:hypothetical protein [Sphingobacterium sp. ML3W]AIM36670.1 hypothetical protein KO02_08075 [Sphingobacterium sp. ML3W]
MKKILIIAVTLLTLSCSKEDKIVETTNYFTPIEVDGQVIKIAQENITGNEKCNTLHANMSFKQGDENLMLNFSFLKTGELINVRLDRMENGIGFFTYLTPSFNPDTTIKIKNFGFNSDTKQLTFEFEGNLLYEQENSKLLHLKGNFATYSLKNETCTVPNNNIYYTSDSFKFNTKSWNFYHTTSEESSYKFWSTYGTTLEIKLEKKLEDLPLGKIPVGKLPSANQLILKKYVGPMIATQQPTTSESDFMTYTVVGTIDIQEKITLGTDKYTKGTIDLDAIYDGKIMFQVRDMNFQIKDF